MRKGEAQALRWEDVDFDAGTVTVRATLSRVNGKTMLTEPKTRKSRRVLAPSEGVMRVLKRQQVEQAKDRLAAGSQWLDSGFVFTSAFGAPLDGRNVLRAFTTAAAKAGVEGASVHTLRHSAATAILENGVHPRAVSDLLGHADSRITLGIYAHMTNETARKAMDGLGGVLGL